MREASGQPGPAGKRRAGRRLVFGFAAFAAALFLLTRLALLALRDDALGSDPWAVARALAAGGAYDLLILLWLSVPLALYLVLLPARWFATRLQRALLWTGIAAASYGLLFVAAAECFFFDEFESRFNFVAVDYLVYPHEVVANIWQSYPTAWILAGLVLPACGVALAIRRAVGAAVLEARRARTALLFSILVACAALTSAVSPAWGNVSSDRALNEVSRNGIYTFFAALRGSQASFEGLYRTLPEREVFQRLSGLLAESSVAPGSFESGSTLRRIDNAGPERRSNVVVVLEESLGSEFVGALRRGSDRSLTPSLDALASEGTLLTRAYSTGNRTIRAIEATTSGLPPLPGISIVRRPQSQDLFTLPALLRERGYETLFVYGGRTLFDGMGSYLERNGVEHLIEQRDYPPDTFTTAWGVADEAIFERALTEMDGLERAGQPFYALVLSVTNHRPFLFPEGELRRDPALSGRQNAVRYADWALGRFMSAARRRSWYDDTLFVLMGDHGARVYGAAEIPLASYEVPILLLGPGVERNRRVDTLASSLDIPPTVLGVLGLDYDSKFFGRDVLRLAPDEGRALMTHNSSIALLEGRRMAVLGLRSTARVYDCDLDRATCSEDGSARAVDSGLVTDAVAYYWGADLLYGSRRLGLERTRAQTARADPPAGAPDRTVAPSG